VFSALAMLEDARRVMLCMSEAVEGELCLLEVLEAIAVCFFTHTASCGNGLSSRVSKSPIVVVFSYT